MKVPDRLTYALPSYPPLKRLLIRSIEKTTGRDELVDIYSSIPDEYAGKSEFFEAFLKKLDIDLIVDEKQLAKIPPTGPLVFLANHPFGLLDGAALSMLAARYREKWGILLNVTMAHFDDFKDNILPISFEGDKEAIKLNIETRRKTINMLKGDASLVVFPSGGVMTSEGVFGPITDIDWKLFTAKLIHKSKATVIPVYFNGTNSRKFHVVSQFNYSLRVSLYLHELMNKRGKPLKVEVGDPIPYEIYSEIPTKQELTKFLRQAVFSMAPPHVVGERRTKNYLDVEIGQPISDIRQERRLMKRKKMKQRVETFY